MASRATTSGPELEQIYRAKMHQMCDSRELMLGQRMPPKKSIRDPQDGTCLSPIGTNPIGGQTKDSIIWAIAHGALRGLAIPGQARLRSARTLREQVGIG